METRSTANSKMLIKDHRHSRGTHPNNSSTQGSRATQGSSRATDLPRVVQALSILIILRVKVSNMGAIDLHSQDHPSNPSRGLTGTTRDNMEITSSENVLTFQ